MQAVALPDLDRLQPSVLARNMEHGPASRVAEQCPGGNQQYVVVLPDHDAHFDAILVAELLPGLVGIVEVHDDRCLDNLEIGVHGDPRVGHTAATVPMEMDKFSEDMRSQLALVEHHLGAPQRIFSASDKLVSYVRFVAALFVYFLEVHPYANGNGHTARTIVLLLLGRINIYPRQAWTIEPRPADPPYTNLISRYRSGDQDPLVRFIIKAL